MTIISGQTVTGKTQCGKIDLWPLVGFIIKNISEYTILGSRFGKPLRENSRSTALGWSKTKNTHWSTPSNVIYKTQPDRGLETPGCPWKTLHQLLKASKCSTLSLEGTAIPQTGWRSPFQRQRWAFGGLQRLTQCLSGADLGFLGLNLAEFCKSCLRLWTSQYFWS